MAALTLDDLKAKAASGEIDTVLVCTIDMQGRLMGKRFHVSNFLEHSIEETHCCNYLIATDLEMATPDGYATTSWAAGYGDYVMQPDLSTLRPVPWLEGTAMILCDLLDHHTHKPVPQSPRQILKAQVARAEAMGLTPMMATELEFFLFQKSYDQIRDTGYRDLTTLVRYNQDYSIQMTTREEFILRPVRNALYAMGIPVENTKGEAETGQEELNIRFGDAMMAADQHTIAKHAVKEIAEQHGHAATFLPKWHPDRVGSAAHIHQSLMKGSDNAFHDADRPHGMSEMMESYVAGLIKYAPEITLLMAPYINSYKRFVPGTFAPTKTAWSIDNRTAGFRLVGENTKGVRIECRIPGSDMNPYLACAAQLAAGLAGVEEKLELPAPVTGDVYGMQDVPEVPATLRDATATFRNSAMLRETLGDAVVDHYTRAAEVEQEDFDRAVTDYELQRGFEKA
ncbi:glutamine synthetase family protein [Salipiger mucosus]|uniref:Glutamine synthetase family protein n=1 Tax=Salipiger mucosus DSM 16094 TaxID=1123237 RepID=S9QI44_9RHOB|nr:glutamine synthetase family protein [Salipiger mucosus]EPX79502.1 glutamine synthetase family protein [Salipiger mucosus DSM 16094]